MAMKKNKKLTKYLNNIVPLIMICFVLIGSLFFLTSDSTAEPSRKVKWLMNEPVSLFTLGMQNINNKLQQIGFEDVQISSAYEWSENKIIISAIIPEKGTEKKCKKTIDAIRKMGYVDPKTGELGRTSIMKLDILSAYSEGFIQAGNTTKNTPKGIGKEIDRMISIIAMYTSNYAICSGPLLSNKVNYKMLKIGK
jgi:hypothetical protein